MMHPVHVRCDHQLAQHAVGARRELPVGVVELGEGIQRDFKDEGRPGRYAEQEHHGPLPRERNQCLGWMESKRRHHVDVRV